MGYIILNAEPKSTNNILSCIFKLREDCVEGGGNGIFPGSTGSEFKVVRAQTGWDVPRCAEEPDSQKTE